MLQKKVRMKWILGGLLLNFLAFESYVILAHPPSGLSLSTHLGNSSEMRAVLEDAPPKKEFTFAVMGDTKGGNGIFAEIVQRLRMAAPDFVVRTWIASSVRPRRHHWT